MFVDVFVVVEVVVMEWAFLIGLVVGSFVELELEYVGEKVVGIGYYGGDVVFGVGIEGVGWVFGWWDYVLVL